MIVAVSTGEWVFNDNLLPCDGGLRMMHGFNVNRERKSGVVYRDVRRG